MALMNHEYKLRKKKGKYDIEYSLTSASDGPDLEAGGPTLKFRVHAENRAGPDLSVWRPRAGSLLEAPTHPQMLYRALFHHKMVAKKQNRNRT